MNNDMTKSSPSAAGFFYRKIGGTLFKVRVSDGELKETQTANYFSNFYPIDCEVPSVNA